MPQLETATHCNLNTLQRAAIQSLGARREGPPSQVGLYTIYIYISRRTTVRRSGTVSWVSKELTGFSQKHPRKKVGPRQAQEIREVTSLAPEVPPKNGEIALLLATNRECEVKYVSQKRYGSIN